MYKYYINGLCILFGLGVGFGIGALSRPTYYYAIEYADGTIMPNYMTTTSKKQCMQVMSDIRIAQENYAGTHPNANHLYVWCIPDRDLR